MRPVIRQLPTVLLVLLVAMGCASGEDAPTAAVVPSRPDAARGVAMNVSSVEDDDDDDDDDPNLLRCAPLTADSAAAWIGPTGGTLQIGPHRFEVPAGALAAPTRITARIQPDSLVAVKFGPAGLVFAEKARLHLATGHCTAFPTSSLAIAHVNDAGTSLIEVLSSNEEAGGIWAEIAHFTRYAIAY